MTMRTIKTTSGAPITLDGDLLAVMEALYREVTAKRDLDLFLRLAGFSKISRPLMRRFAKM